MCLWVNVCMALLIMCLGYLFCVVSLSKSFLAVVRKSFNLYALVMENEWSLPMMEPMWIVIGVWLL